MKTEEHAKLDAYCEELHKPIDAIRAIVWEPNTTLPRVRRKVAFSPELLSSLRPMWSVAAN